MLARFDENLAMTLQDIKKTKPYGRTDGRMHTWMDGQHENSILTTNKVCRGYNKTFVAFPWVVTSTGPGGFMICMCIFMMGTPEGSTESGLQELIYIWFHTVFERINC